MLAVHVRNKARLLKHLACFIAFLVRIKVKIKNVHIDDREDLSNNGESLEGFKWRMLITAWKGSNWRFTVAGMNIPPGLTCLTC